MTLVAVTAAAADDRAAELLLHARAALGGPALDKVTAISATGEWRRTFGDRELSGDLTIDLAAPDRIRRTEEMGFPGGPSMTRIVAVNGGEFWEDSTNRGGFLRMAPGGAGGPGGPGGPGGTGREPTEEERERFRDMQKRRLAGDLMRYQLAWLLRTSAAVTHAGTAEAEDGRAEVLEIRADGQEPMRLFLDATTYQPLMLTFEGFMPRMRMTRLRQGEGGQGAAGSPPPADAGPPANEPPPRVTFELRFDDYREVDGVLLPHRLTQSVDGTPMEEWTIARYKLNPSFKKDAFGKK